VQIKETYLIPVDTSHTKRQSIANRSGNLSFALLQMASNHKFSSNLA